MDSTTRKPIQRARRHRRVRKKVVGAPSRPRLCVFRSAKHIYAQLIDDSKGQTLASASTQKIGEVKKDDKVGRKMVAAREVGKTIAEEAKKHGIEEVAFDRGGYRYHGRLAALAEAARAAGLKF